MPLLLTQRGSVVGAERRNASIVAPLDGRYEIPQYPISLRIQYENSIELVWAPPLLP